MAGYFDLVFLLIIVERTCAGELVIGLCFRVVDVITHPSSNGQEFSLRYAKQAKVHGPIILLCA